MIRNLMFLIVFYIPLTLSSQEKHKSTEQPSNNRLLIENGSDQGLTYTDSLGIQYKYLYTTSTITNNSAIPIHLQIAISGEYNNPDFCTDGKYKLFILPKELTPDTATLHNNIFDGLDNFLSRCIDTPYILNKILEPGENKIVTIGRLFPRPATCGKLPDALFAKGDSLYFGTSDHSYFIPCGKFSYPNY